MKLSNNFSEKIQVGLVLQQLSSDVLKGICFQKKKTNRSAIIIGTIFDTSSWISETICATL